MKINLNSQIKDTIAGGLADKKSLEDIAAKHNAPMELIELMFDWGVKVEMEHTNDEAIAQEIAKDHLWEDPVYYKKLKEIERN